MADCTWQILRVEAHKESTVCLALERAGAIVFIPTVYLSKTLSRQQNRVKMVPVPVIRRIIFFQGNLSHIDLEKDGDIRHSLGIARSPITGSPWLITNAKMMQFRDYLAADYLGDGEWLPVTPAEKKAHKQREKDLHTVKSLAELDKFVPELFGIEQEIAA